MSTHNKILSLTSQKKSWRWLSLLPSVSVSSTWDPFTQVYRPMVNFGITLSNLSTYIQVSNRNRIEREKLAISLQEQLSSEINTIDAEILDLQRDSIALAYEYQNITLLEELNTIKLKQYEQNQINLEEKIRHQMNLNNSKNTFEIRKINYINRRNKLINKLKKPSKSTDFLGL
ncbi:hypothetical protein OKE68_05885 [Riemerella anatipestifer]|uniref:Uncharacterized protein n=3 Tax=Riemerella anatipestifer TaxID=34085 RepID=J9R3E1_RIEAN|nr:hypothetical protein [Riemerella anatipestifer]AFR36384.1 hypothetical protein B739_1800 [Riemerella anatipestifer RA-CH-1]AIH03344.1 hypothetical protein M949_2178 [Riemerella anatipestifer CH3]AQY22861.1 hypothetical protein AB406_1920 [Riemerella anatipestifer]MCU7568293.1 hypothetical protein [Riemerella anatipestifer]MCU7582689.1 hypothetical protein [Riemerella anatipestifer]